MSEVPAPAPRVAFPPNWPFRIGLVALALYVVYASTILDISWARFVSGFEHGARFIRRMFPPNLAHDKLDLLASGMAESLQIAIIATVVGVLLSLPLGLAAARNLAPWPLAWTARALVALFRTFHPVIVAILFVKAVGFGALAGMLALIVASLGFLSKLIAEAVEEMSMKQVEAVRATGAPFMNVITYGVLPQVFSRFIGFATYQLDSNLRNSTMVGIVGAGGICGALFAAFQRFDYDFVCAMLLAIIFLIFVGEVIATRVRAIFLERGKVDEE